MTKIRSPFIQSYIETALWSSTEYKFGACPCCGEQKILSHYPEEEFEQVPMCSSVGCGVREIPNPDPMDKNYSEDNISEDAIATMIFDCANFQADNASDLSGEDDAQVARDFWLTRNRQGTGFWDGDYKEEKRRRLTESAHKFGECNLYVGDDGKLYLW